MSSPKLCTACNETYALGAAVAICSALRRIPETSPEATIYVLDGGMRKRTWKKLSASILRIGRRCQLVRLKPEMARFAGLPQDWGSSVMTYARLALPELVDEERLIYLDADLVVQTDVTKLATLDLEGNVVAAARDVITETLGNENLPMDEFNLRADAAYLQAGLLVIDLPRWRRENVSERVLKYLRTWPDNAQFWDQSALNVILYGRWKALPDTWNMPAWWAEQNKQPCHLNGEVLHFVGPNKPWLLGYHQGAAANRFFEEVRTTNWGTWKPNRLRFAAKWCRYRITQTLAEIRSKACHPKTVSSP
ncbi:MAG TPA: glycosyltransferase family 8 protein [Chthoniobacterales bacterium]